MSEDFIRVDQYTVVKMENYKGVFSLTEGWEGRDGVFKANWIKQPFGKEKIEKELPKKIKLGDKETAKNVLLMLLAQLGEPIEPQAAPMEEIPF
jgi:hypothetical protein